MKPGEPAVWTIVEATTKAGDDVYVIREYSAAPWRSEPTGRAWIADTLDDARTCVPPGMVRQDRHPTDDPSAVESWMTPEADVMAKEGMALLDAFDLWPGGSSQPPGH